MEENIKKEQLAKLVELADEELKQVVGGAVGDHDCKCGCPWCQPAPAE